MRSKPDIGAKTALTEIGARDTGKMNARIGVRAGRRVLRAGGASCLGRRLTRLPPALKPAESTDRPGRSLAVRVYRGGSNSTRERVRQEGKILGANAPRRAGGRTDARELAEQIQVRLKGTS